MTSHLLSLSTLHAAAPGVLDVVFGPDGDFQGASEWRCPIWDSENGPDGDWMGISRYARHPIADQFDPLDTMFFDLRISSVAARLAGLCNRAMLLGEMEIDDATADVFSRAMWGTARGWGWRDGHAAFLASLTLALAPRIAALGGYNV